MESAFSGMLESLGSFLWLVLRYYREIRDKPLLLQSLMSHLCYMSRYETVIFILTSFVQVMKLNLYFAMS